MGYGRQYKRVKVYRFRLYPAWCDNPEPFIGYIARGMHIGWNRLTGIARTTQERVFHDLARTAPDEYEPLLYAAEMICEERRPLAKEHADVRQKIGQRKNRGLPVDDLDRQKKRLEQKLNKLSAALSAKRQAMWALAKDHLDLTQYNIRWYRELSGLDISSDEKEEIVRRVSTTYDNYRLRRVRGRKAGLPKFRKWKDEGLPDVTFAHRFAVDRRTGREKPRFGDLIGDGAAGIRFFGFADGWDDPDIRPTRLRKTTFAGFFEYPIRNFSGRARVEVWPRGHREILRFRPILHRLPPLEGRVAMVRLTRSNGRWHVNFTVEYEDHGHVGDEWTGAPVLVVPYPRIVHIHGATHLQCGYVFNTETGESEALYLTGPLATVPEGRSGAKDLISTHFHTTMLDSIKDDKRESGIKRESAKREAKNLKARMRRFRRDAYAKMAHLIVERYRPAEVWVPKDRSEMVGKSEWQCVKIPKQVVIDSNRIKGMVGASILMGALKNKCSGLGIKFREIDNEKVKEILGEDAQKAA